MTAARPLRPVDVLVVLGHELHVRNFVASGWLRMLSTRGHRVMALVPAANVPAVERLIGDAADVRPIEPYAPARLKISALHWLRLASWVRGASRWTEHRRKLEWERPTFDRRVALAAWRRMVRAQRNPEAAARRVVDALPISRAAKDLVHAVDPAVVFWPTTLSHYGEVDIIEAARRAGRTVLMFEGSWDNLLGKGPIWPRPDRVLVWGDMSASILHERHGFTSVQTDITGPPHFDVYGQSVPERVDLLKRLGLDPAKRTILFGGSTLEMASELPTLRLVSGWIDTGLLPPSQIWYRAHPRGTMRQPGHAAEVAKVPHVIVDPGIPAGERGANVWAVHADDATQRAWALAACDVMLSTFSTVVVEAALLGKPSLLVAFGMRNGVFEPRLPRYSDFGHVQYLTRSPWIRFTTAPDDLLTRLNRLLTAPSPEAPAELRAFAQTIAYVGDAGPRERIVAEVEAAVAARRRGAA